MARLKALRIGVDAAVKTHHKREVRKFLEKRGQSKNPVVSTTDVHTLRVENYWIFTLTLSIERSREC